MSNATLTSRAKSLEDSIRPKLKCYVKVGWSRAADSTESYVVYIDQRANINFRQIPEIWYGDQVDIQLVLPPGVKPIDLPSMPW